MDIIYSEFFVTPNIKDPTLFGWSALFSLPVYFLINIVFYDDIRGFLDATHYVIRALLSPFIRIEVSLLDLELVKYVFFIAACAAAALLDYKIAEHFLAAG